MSLCVTSEHGGVSGAGIGGTARKKQQCGPPLPDCSGSSDCCCCCSLFQATSSSSTSFTTSSSTQGRTRSFSLLPPPLSHHHPAPPVASSFISNTSSSPGTQRKPLYPGVGGVVTITHHRSPAAARRARTQNNQNYHPAPGRLSQVKEVMTQAEGQQKNLVNSIESLPSRGPLSSLDQDLLLLKATSAATLSCLGECLHMLQHNVSQAAQHVTLGRSDSQDRSQSPIHKQTSSQSNSNISSQTHNHNHNQFKKQMSLDPNHVPTAPSDSFAGWPRSPSEKQVTNRGGTPLPHVPSPAHINKELVINCVVRNTPALCVGRNTTLYCILSPSGRDPGPSSFRTLARPSFRTLAHPSFRTLARPSFRTLARPSIRTLTRPSIRTLARPSFRTLARPSFRTLARPSFRTLTRSSIRTLARPSFRTLARPAFRTLARPSFRRATRMGIRMGIRVSDCVLHYEETPPFHILSSFFSPPSFPLSQSSVVTDHWDASKAILVFWVFLSLSVSLSLYLPSLSLSLSLSPLSLSLSLSLSLPSLSLSGWWICGNSARPRARDHRLHVNPATPSRPPPTPESIDPSEEMTDTEDSEEEDLGVREDQRNIILHLLSQLKLGMDLTRVVLPTFILEKRSLLEMYANFMAHPDMFLAITTGTTPEERIVRFVEYYLTAFHEGRKGAVAKKPYNPILGESFRCSWDVPRERVHPLRTMSSVPNTNTTPTSNPAPNPASSSRGSSPNPASSSRGSSPNPASSSRGPSPNPASSSRGPSPNPASSSRASRRTGTESGGAQAEDCYRVRFVAEQVSHHPPVTGFYCECKERNMCVNTHVWTRSKFMGMSIGVSMVGEGVLRLLEHDEEYVFTLPCAYARSILTVPWVELGGKVTISCAKSGYSATVTFHTKPFYGGKIHRVTAEVKHNPTGTIVCKAQGEWNGTLEFTYSSGETKVINTSKLPVIRKKIRPMDKQGHYESRRLWQHVTSALRSGNIDSATEHKHCLEERQRAEGRQRAASNTPWKPKYFIKEGEGWVYHNPLWKTH
ncbi:oxysterol-binding protein-related protein 10 [Salmo salar]|uniref:Oxysterol-binding protein n=1 Tax=Salmo salar TaxID=8030 RepID=A0ABM3ERP3_SALSA|nr:oxysterol-binding protein-related protein 10-like [Salmo salar]